MSESEPGRRVAPTPWVARRPLLRESTVPVTTDKSGDSRLPTGTIRFSQNTVSGPTRLDGTLLPLTRLLEIFAARKEYVSEPIDVVRMPDGRFTSLDNRRLWASQLVGLPEIPVNVHEMTDPIPTAEEASRYVRSKAIVDRRGELGPTGAELFPAGHVPRTYGEAVLIRCGSQTKLRKGEAFPVLGADELARYTGERASDPIVGTVESHGQPSPALENEASETRPTLRRPKGGQATDKVATRPRATGTKPGSEGIQR